MPMYIKVSGAWKEISEPHIKVSGAWKAVQAGYIKVSGAWKEFYTAVLVYTPAITATNNTLSGTGGGPRTVSFSLLNSGYGSVTGASGVSPVGGSFAWLLAGSASEYEAYVTGADTNGGTFSGTLNSWVSLGTTRAWSFSTTNNDSDWNGTYQIRRISDAAGSSSGTISFTVNTAP